MTFKSRCVFRGDGTCSARFLPSYSLSLYAFIFIKGILLLFILRFNSLSRLPLKTRHSRRVFFTRRSSPDTRIKKIAATYCCRNFFGRGDGTWTHDLLVPNQARYQTALHLVATSFLFVAFIIILHLFSFRNCFNALFYKFIRILTPFSFKYCLRVFQSGIYSLNIPLNPCWWFG